MGFLSCCFCGSSSQQQQRRKREKTTTKSSSSLPLSSQQQHLHHIASSLDQSMEEDNDEDDIRAVKSWREKRTTPPLPLTSTTTAAVSSLSGDDRKLTTIEEGSINDSRNTSVASLTQPELPPPHVSQTLTPTIVDDTNHTTISSSQSSNFPITSSNKNNNQQQHPPAESQGVSNSVGKYNDFSTNVPSNDSLSSHLLENTTNGFSNNQEKNSSSSNNSYSYNYSNDNYVRHVHQSVHYGNGAGGFPTLSPQEEEWRRQEQPEYQHPQDEYLSSSSNSTIEDPILVPSSNDDHDHENNDDDDRRKGATGPIDLDDDEFIDPLHEENNNSDGRHRSKYNPRHYHDDDHDDDHPDDSNDMDILSSSFLSSTSSSKRPGPDNDTDIDRPNHVTAHHSKLYSTHNNWNDNSNVTTSTAFNYNHPNSTKIVSKQQQQLQEKSPSSSILRDKEPELYSINNSAESEELDAMIAAIDSNKSDPKIPTIPLPTTTTTITKDTLTRIRSSRNSQSSSPTLLLTASQQSSPSLHSGSRNSGPSSIKLSPNRRDSPSVHDPTSYMVMIPPHDNKNNNAANNIITTTEQGMHHSTVPTLISPSSDGSDSIGPRTTATTTTTTMVPVAKSRRGRSSTITTAAMTSSSTNSSPFLDTSTTNAIVIIPETAQQRRKARSQSRGRRIRERARTLLASYNNDHLNQSDIEHNLTTLEPTNTNAHPVNVSVPTIIQSVATENGLGNTVLNTPQTTIENENQNDLPFVLENLSSNNTRDKDEGLSTTRSLEYTTGIGNKQGNSTITVDETHRPSDMDHSDRLSDIPSEVDPTLRERYLKACRILKSSLLEKDATIRPSDKAFLSQLLLETTPSKDDDNGRDEFLTEEKVKQYESTVHNTLLERSTPLFDTATTVVTDDFSQTPIDDGFGHTIVSGSAMNDNEYIGASMSGESSGVTEQELQIHNYVMNTHHDYKDSFHPKQMQVHTTTTTSSQVSSSVFSRVDDDYPFSVWGLDDGRHSKVLLPWMMNALRGFFPLEISNHNFWLKYQLDRNTNINHEDNLNLSTLLSKVQHDTYTILCVETVDGYVFGAFCSAPWEIQSSWYGSGDSSFLWRLKHPRRGRTTGNDSNTKNDDGNTNEIEIYPYTRYDSYVQYCSNQTLAVGGGTDWTLTKEGYSPYHHPPSDDESRPHDEQAATGIGFLLDGDLMGGETNSCVTYANPPLGNNNDKNIDGTNEFDIQTLEVYTISKFSVGQEAETNS